MSSTSELLQGAFNTFKNTFSGGKRKYKKFKKNRGSGKIDDLTERMQDLSLYDVPFITREMRKMNLNDKSSPKAPSPPQPVVQKPRTPSPPQPLATAILQIPSPPVSGKRNRSSSPNESGAKKSKQNEEQRVLEAEKQELEEENKKLATKIHIQKLKAKKQKLETKLQESDMPKQRKRKTSDDDNSDASAKRSAKNSSSTKTSPKQRKRKTSDDTSDTPSKRANVAESQEVKQSPPPAASKSKVKTKKDKPVRLSPIEEEDLVNILQNTSIGPKKRPKVINGKLVNVSAKKAQKPKPTAKDTDMPNAPTRASSRNRKTPDRFVPATKNTGIKK